MKKPPPPQAKVLPPDAREALVAASKLRDERERRSAVQEAIERAQRKYPQFFNLTEGVPQ